MTSGNGLAQLLACATGIGDIAAAWVRWRARPGGFENATPGERALLPMAWQRASAAGCDDPDAGRMRGVQRQATAANSEALDRAVIVQSRLAEMGIVTALTGRLGASWDYPAKMRPGSGPAELLIDLADAMALLQRRPHMRARLRGWVAYDDAWLRWRSPLRLPAATTPSRDVDWRGRSLRLAPPHRIAYDAISSAAASASQDAIAAALLDLDTLRASAPFDPDAFADAVNRGGLSSAIAARTDQWRACIPAATAALLPRRSPTSGATTAILASTLSGLRRLSR